MKMLEYDFYFLGKAESSNIQLLATSCPFSIKKKANPKSGYFFFNGFDLQEFKNLSEIFSVYNKLMFLQTSFINYSSTYGYH